MSVCPFVCANILKATSVKYQPGNLLKLPNQRNKAPKKRNEINKVLYTHTLCLRHNLYKDQFKYKL